MMNTLDIPSSYKYNYFKNENKCSSFRIQSILNKEQFKKWLDEYSECTATTWRILKTFPNSGRTNVYKSVWRCHHNVYKQRGAVPSNRRTKNTNCPAKITAVIKRFMEKSRSKNSDYILNKEWPCKIELDVHHNHPLKAVSALIHSPPSKKVEDKSTNLYFIPLYSTCEALDTIHDQENIGQEIVYVPANGFDNGMQPSNLWKDFNELVCRIKHGISENPTAFVPALHVMMKNVRNYVDTDNSLIRAMRMFGKYSVFSVNKGTKRHSKTGVQASVARRKNCTLIVKQGSKEGKPVHVRTHVLYLDHDYTNFNPLLQKARKLNHNLEKCAQSNQALPN